MERIAGHTTDEVRHAAVLPALLTPFDNDGEVDSAALRDHVGFVIEAGVDGIMPCGTTGETALLEPDEMLAAVRRWSRRPPAGCRSWPTSGGPRHGRPRA